MKARVDGYNLWARADNRGSDYVGPYQAEVGGIWNGPAAIDQSLSVRAIGTPLQVDELKYVDLSFSQEIDSEGTAIVISASGMVSQPGKELIALDLESRSLGLDFLLRFKPIRSREMNMLVSIGGSVNESETTALGFPLSEERSRSLSIGSEFQLADRFGGATSVTAGVSKGLELLGATPSGDPLLSRSDAKQDAVWFDVTLSRLQNLAALARGFSLQASITGQYSLDPLSASREFAVGGRSNASGFDSSEIAGDHGASGRLELRYSTALPMIEDVVPGGTCEEPGSRSSLLETGELSGRSTAISPASRTRKSLRQGSVSGSTLGQVFPAVSKLQNPSSRMSAPRVTETLGYFLNSQPDFDGASEK